MNECKPITNHEGFLVNPCNGEVIDFEGYDGFDKQTIALAKEPVKKTAPQKKIRNTKDSILEWLLSKMDKKEKDMFYEILNKVNVKHNAALYLAIYEIVQERLGRPVRREYLEWLSGKGVKRYAIRQRKAIVRKAITTTVQTSDIKPPNRKLWKIMLNEARRYGVKVKKRQQLAIDLYNNTVLADLENMYIILH